MSIERFRWIWATRQFLHQLILIYPVYAVMMEDAGISPLELSLLFMAWGSTGLLLEVPSGTLADRVSRKSILVAAGIIKAAAFPLWLAFPSFAGFLAGFLVWGVAGTFSSGTREAFVHDTLAEQEAEAQFERVYGLGRGAEFAGGGLAMALGGAMAQTGYETPLLWSSATPLLGAVLLAITCHEPTRSGIEPDDEAPDLGYWATMRAGWREATRTRAITTLVVLFATLVVVPGVIDEYIGPLNRERGLSLLWLGVVAAATAAAAALGSATAHHLPTSEAATALRLPLGVFALSSAALLGALAGPPWLLALGLVAFFGGCGAFEVLLQGQLQRTIRGPARATVTSLVSMALETSGIALYLVIGLLAAAGTWASATAWVAGTSAACGLLLLALQGASTSHAPAG